MTERTYNIIMACKRSYPRDLTDNVAQYMAKECGCSVGDYSQPIITDIMKTALYDYIDTCDKPSIILRKLDENNRFYHDVSIGAQIATAFRSVQVRDRNGNYINGFGEWIKEE